MKAQDAKLLAKLLKELERENVRLKRIVAEPLLGNQALREIAKRGWRARRQPRGRDDPDLRPAAAALEPRLEDHRRLRGRLEDLRQADCHSE